MASKESLGRVRHFDLATQQRRLRHLRSISTRNIRSKLNLGRHALLDCLLETYFTLHVDDEGQNVVYTSEKIKFSLNPTWTSFEPYTWSDDINKAVTSIIVRIWGVQHSKDHLVIEWIVHLPSLKYLGDQIRTSQHKPNTLIFGLADGYYGAPEMHTLQVGDSTNAKTSPTSGTIKIDQEQVRPSYSGASVLRLNTIQKAIRQTQLAVHKACSLIEDNVKSVQTCTAQLGEEESLKLRMKLLREELASKQSLLKKEREEDRKFLEKLRGREKNLERKKEELEQSQRAQRKHRQAHVDRREALVKLNAKLNIRRRQLVSELKYIYPIVQHLDTKELLISGVRLPDSESVKFIAMDEDSLSVAIGNVCHLVSRIAKLLELPLRYPMDPQGSRSSVMDHTIDKVADKERQFTLSHKGKEKVQFNYGVYLLNKNIAQLRQYCGLNTPNLRNTLPNLKELLDTKFQVSGLKSPPVPIVKRWPAKHTKPRSEGSPSSSPRNPKLDDVLLKTMMAAPADVKTMQSQAPSQATVTQHPGIINAGTQIGAKPRAPTLDDDLKVPAQSAPHKFLFSKKARNVDVAQTRTTDSVSIKNKNSVQTNDNCIGGQTGRTSQQQNLLKQSSTEYDHVDVHELSAPNSEDGRVKGLDVTDNEPEDCQLDPRLTSTPGNSTANFENHSIDNKSEDSLCPSEHLFHQENLSFDLQENGDIDLR